MTSKLSDYKTARRRATAKYGFYVHAAVFAAVMVLLLIINLATSRDILWVIWPLLGWGIALALHGARVFMLSDKNAIIDALTEQELRRSSVRTDDTSS